MRKERELGRKETLFLLFFIAGDYDALTKCTNKGNHQNSTTNTSKTAYSQNTPKGTDYIKSLKYVKMENMKRYDRTETKPICLLSKYKWLNLHVKRRRILD